MLKYTLNSDVFYLENANLMLKDFANESIQSYNENIKEFISIACKSGTKYF